MPYKTIKDLPEKVQHVLPAHAQEIYLAAFNHAAETYKEAADMDAIAAKIAWTAVKTKYQKDLISDKWIKISNP